VKERERGGERETERYETLLIRRSESREGGSVFMRERDRKEERKI
jgi:hypothetical protein